MSFQIRMNMGDNDKLGYNTHKIGITIKGKK